MPPAARGIGVLCFSAAEPALGRVGRQPPRVGSEEKLRYFCQAETHIPARIHCLGSIAQPWAAHCPAERSAVWALRGCARNDLCGTSRPGWQIPLAFCTVSLSEGSSERS